MSKRKTANVTASFPNIRPSFVIRYSRNTNIEIAEQAVGDIVDPAVDGEGMAARPRIYDGARARDIFDLFDHIELAQTRSATFRFADGVQLRFVFLAQIVNRAQPVVDQTVLLMFKSRVHAAASVMSTNDDVLDAQNIDRELQHRKTIQIVRQDQVADVAMNENLARWNIDNLIRRDPAIRTADPEILGRLLMCEAIEEIRIALVHPTRPSRVLIEEMGQFASRYDGVQFHTRNFPARMIGSPSNQMSKSRPTQSMCVFEIQLAPVCSA
jgi:hypothetical protein